MTAAGAAITTASYVYIGWCPLDATRNYGTGFEMNLADTTFTVGGAFEVTNTNKGNTNEAYKATVNLNGSQLSVNGAFKNDQTIHLTNSSLALKAAATNSGTFAMDWNSTVSFVDFTNSGTFTVDLEGYSGGEKKLLDYTGSGTLTEAYYQTLLGGSWNDTCFTVKDNDLYISRDTPAVVYVNCSYSEGNCDGHTWGVDAFANSESALAQDPVKMIFTGGIFDTTVTMDGREWQIDDGDYTRPVLAGYRIDGKDDRVDHSGDITGRVNSGVFRSNLIGADSVVSGSSMRTGNVSMTVDGGVFDKQVVGGMYLAHTDPMGVICLKGDVNMTISGGQFKARVYGGNFSYNDASSGRMTLTGDINLTIDAGKDVSIGEHVIAGSRGDGRVDGNITVTVTGNGDHLIFNGLLFGGCSGDGYRMSNGVRSEDTSVTGDRELVFNDFSNGFGARISMFKSIRFTGNSVVEFTNAALNLSDVSNWNFEFGSSLSGVVHNDFAADALNFDLTGWKGNPWEVMSGSASAFKNWDFTGNRVTLGGETAAWDSDISGWCSSNYQLTLEEEGNNSKWIISKLA